jgi:hypothetical protein
MASLIKIRQALLNWNPNKILRTIGLCRLSCWSANCTHPNAIVALPVNLVLRSTYPEPPWCSPCPFYVVRVTTRNSAWNPWSDSAISQQTDSAISQQSDNTTTVSRTCTDARIFARNSFQNLSIQQERQSTYKRNIEARSRNHCCHGKEINITYSEYVFVALDIQHVNLMRRIILSSVACLVVPYFSALSHKRNDFRKKKLLNMKGVFWYSLQFLCEEFLILRRIERDMIKMCIEVM